MGRYIEAILCGCEGIPHGESQGLAFLGVIKERYEGGVPFLDLIRMAKEKFGYFPFKGVDEAEKKLMQQVIACQKLRFPERNYTLIHYPFRNGLVFLNEALQ